MPRYVALLRGVSPMNCRMADLARALEAAGFDRVKTVLGTGNVAFDATSRAERSVEKTVAVAIETGLGRPFGTLVRTQAYLQTLIAADVFSEFGAPPKAKRVVTFLRAAPKAAALPAFPTDKGGAVIYGVRGRELFSAYLPSPKGPVFMGLIEKTFGKDVTTRTFDTVAKCARA